MSNIQDFDILILLLVLVVKHTLFYVDTVHKNVLQITDRHLQS